MHHPWYVPAAIATAVLTLPGCSTWRACASAACTDDAHITASIETLIRQHPALEAPNSVRVQAVNRVVYLYGEVDNEVERSEAESLAHQVAGVSRVVDSINFPYQGR